ncbi:MAG: thiol reductant ABC exporter subunit CydC [Allorhizobium sp.]
MNTGLSVLTPILSLFLRERRGMLLAGAALAGVTAIAGIALLGVSGWFITATAIAGLVPATALAFDVFSPSAAIRFLALARTGARYGERLATHDATLSVLAGLRETLFRGYAAPKAARALALRPAKLLFRLTSDTDALDSLYLRVLVPAGVAIASALGVSVAFAFIDTRLAAGVGLFLLGCGLAIPVIAARAALAPVRRRAHALEALRARVSNLVAARTDLLMAGRLQAQTQAVGAAEARLAEADDALNRIETAVTVAFGAVSALLLSGILLAVASLSEHSLIGAPAAALCLLMAFAAVEPFAALRRGALELGRTLVAARRIGPQLRRPGHSAIRSAPPADLALQLAGVDLRYPGATEPVLEDISLSLARGEKIAIVGPSGSGKSTLLSLIAGDIDPETGAIASLHTALLTQRTELFQDSLRDNLRLADPEAGDERLGDALKAAGLAALFASLPKGLSSRLGEGGAGLSGGQARRLAVARLMLRDTPIWLLDEPTEGLDGETARDVMARVNAAVVGRSLVIATHLRREAVDADRLLVMERGRIVTTCDHGSETFNAVLSSLRPD